MIETSAMKELSFKRLAIKPWKEVLGGFGISSRMAELKAPLRILFWAILRNELKSSNSQ